MHMVILLYSLFASVFTAAKLGVENCQPFFLVGSRMLLAGIMLFLWTWWRRPSDLARIKDNWIALVVLGLFNIYLTNGLEFWGMQYLTSSKTSFIYSLSPFVAALFSYFTFGEVLTKKKWLGLIIGFLGFIPILYHSTSEESGVLEFGIFSLAELAVMGAAASTVLGWIILRKMMDAGLSPISANGISMIAGGAMSLAHSGLTETWAPTPVYGDKVVFWQSTLWMIVTSSLICYNLYGYLLKRYTVTFMSFSGFITPFAAAIFGYFVIGETVSWSFFASGIVVLIGLSLFYAEELRKEGIRQ